MFYQLLELANEAWEEGIIDNDKGEYFYEQHAKKRSSIEAELSYIYEDVMEQEKKEDLLRHIADTFKEEIA